jgi:hypothetical protein
MMRNAVAIAIAIGTVSASSAALAQTGKENGLALGLRLGYALPMGKAGAPANGFFVDTSKDNLPDNLSGMIPIWLDVGYRVNPSIYVGGFFQYGFAFVNKDTRQECSQGNSCSAHDIAFGANVHYHILPAAPFDPWLGAGLGYEIGTLSESGNSALGHFDYSVNFNGFQFLILEAGGDFKASPDIAVGPFLNFAIGQYSTYSSSTTGNNGNTVLQDGDLTDTGMHQWLTIGVRGQFSL